MLMIKIQTHTSENQTKVTLKFGFTTRRQLPRLYTSTAFHPVAVVFAEIDLNWILMIPESTFFLEIDELMNCMLGPRRVFFQQRKWFKKTSTFRR